MADACVSHVVNNHEGKVRPDFALHLSQLCVWERERGNGELVCKSPRSHRLNGLWLRELSREEPDKLWFGFRLLMPER